MLNLKTSEATIDIKPISNSRFRYHITRTGSGKHTEQITFDSFYGEKVAKALLDMGGADRLISELTREEGHSGLELGLKYYTLSFLPDDDFIGKRLLDFGCGCGASTFALSRIFPNSHILGLDRLADCIRVCNLKKEQLGLDRVSFVTSNSDDQLPAALGHIDYCILCGVYEHLLPPERKSLLHAIWNMLPVGGVLFIAQTPNRYSPIGTHVTRIPMVNFLPDSLAFHVGHWAMKKQYGIDADWERLLRGGFRGGTSHEIERILQETDGVPVFIPPSRLGVRDPIDIWNLTKDLSNLGLIKQVAGQFCRVFKTFTGITIAPYINLAIRKGSIKKQA
ncbi:MAG: class I SAM-dependent methyltransferase [Desulfomonilaceae bacterium]|jgi:2-polyprenyl-3-methyl-5-hydroxy-6-metoxy-1,4-benzoquinol methylase